MKRILALAVAFGLILAVSNGCDVKKNEETGQWEIVGYFSWPTFFIYENAVTDPDNFWSPFTSGDPVEDAVVVVTNETTSESLTLEYIAPDEYHTIGYYTLNYEDYPNGLVHTAGQEVSVSITIGDRTFIGGPTATPDAMATITAPANQSQVSQPFDLTWTVAHETTNASHVVVSVNNYNTDPYTMDSWLLPITTTSDEISGYAPAQYYYLMVYPVNRMSITGHGQTYYAYVGTTEYGMSTMVEITSAQR